MIIGFISFHIAALFLMYLIFTFCKEFWKQKDYLMILILSISLFSIFLVQIFAFKDFYRILTS